MEPEQGSSSFYSLVTTIKRVQELENEKQTLVAETNQTQQYLTLLLLTVQDPQHSPQVQAAAREITFRSRRLTQIV